MQTPLTLQYLGDGEFRAPSRYWASVADRDLVVGETYRLVEHQDRSTASHSHYFAAINEAWQSLPDDLMPEYPNAEVLRKKMLVRAGYADERSIVCSNKAEAQRVAAFIKPMDDYSVVVVREAVVRVFTAQSQSYRAMGKKVFQESKDAVLRSLDELLGVSAGDTARAAA